MLTGDNQATAERIAEELGIDTVIAEVLPEDKARHLQRLQAEGRVVATLMLRRLPVPAQTTRPEPVPAQELQPTS